jgi:AP-4 complex subunit epsilon-1
MSTSNNISSNLNDYIKIKIGECRSKEEEDSHVTLDLTQLKKEIQAKKHSDQQVWEIILRIIYAEMLGHETAFAHSFVAIAVQTPSYKVKRIAYLACSLLFDNDSPFRILIVSSLQKDLVSTCLYNQIIALNTLGMIMSPINVSAFVDGITQQLSSPHLVVRRKALLCFIKMKELLSDNLGEITLDFEHFYMQKGQKGRGIAKGDFSVVLAALGFYRKAVPAYTKKYKVIYGLFKDLLEMLFERK